MGGFHGGHGGGLIGGNGQSTNIYYAYGYINTYGAGQDYQGYFIRHNRGVPSEWDEKICYRGIFGGEYPEGSNSTTVDPQGGWGGGWYTGCMGSHGGPSGGSSYISGHAGCIAITEDATEGYRDQDVSITNPGKTTIQHRSDANAIDKSTHFSGLKFTNTVMIDGEGYNWTTSRGSYVGTPKFSGTGVQAGNPDVVGYAKITTIPDD